VFVTHDQEEALEVADRVVVMDKGKIEQIGTPGDVYDNPATPFVYQFLGNVNLFHSRVHAGFARIGELEVGLPDHADTHDTPALAYIRPHDIDIQRQGTKDTLKVKVSDILAIGPLVRLELERNDLTELIEVELTRERFGELNLVRGEEVFIRPRKLRVFLQ
jgi:sulfate transport system ATP-binding protein